MASRLLAAFCLALSTIILCGMEGPTINQIPADVKSSSAQRLKEKLNIHISSFEIYVNNSLGCGVCECWHTFTSSKSYQHRNKRKEDIVKLLKIVDSDEYNPMRIRCYFTRELGPFEKTVSKNFASLFLGELDDYIANNLVDIVSQSDCILCGDSAVIFDMDCGHLLYCKKCFVSPGGFNSAYKGCPFRCDNSKLRLTEIQNQKMYRCPCGRIPNIAGECQHIAACKECVDSNHIDTCQQCFKKLGNTLQLIFSK